MKDAREDLAKADGTVGRTLAVLDLVADFGRPVRFNDLLPLAGLPKATLYRFLQTLSNQGMLAYDDDRQTYAPGLRLVRLAHAAWAQSSLAPIAAVHLDAGFDTARDMILRLWGPRIAGAEAAAFNPKTALQEWAQAQGMSPPAYAVAARGGPDHAPHFRITVTLDDGRAAVAEGTGTKRGIEQAAAQAMLDKIGVTG